MIITILGARPQFVKAAALSKAFIKAGIQEQIIHTGQHYDAKMSDVFFDELAIPRVHKNLNIGSSNHGCQTGQMLIEIEKELLNKVNDINAVLVYGDTNSTLAGALCAAKLHIPVIHIEAGLRSYNMEMPEEINRILTDRISSMLFCSSALGVSNLANEGINKNVYNVGDIMYDAVLSFLPFAKKPADKKLIHILSSDFNLMTIHRPSNTDNFDDLQEIINGVANTGDITIWPVHPRNKTNIAKLTIPTNLVITEPLSYFEMLFCLSNANKVFTDSGGLQKEAYWLKKPCITIRPQTEWVETLENNWNQICTGSAQNILNCYQTKVDISTWKPLYGNGNASKLIADNLLRYA